MGYGYPELWTTPCETPPAVFGGPLAGYQIRRDSFGVIELLTPHVILVSANDLRPAAPSLGLALTDASGHVAVRLRGWRENTLGDDDHLDDWEHRIVGIELIARPDVVEAIRAFAVARTWSRCPHGRSDRDSECDRTPEAGVPSRRARVCGAPCADDAAPLFRPSGRSPVEVGRFRV